MNITRFIPLFVCAGWLVVGAPVSRAETIQDQIEVARSVLKADRQAVVAEALQLTADEGRAFWPLYHQYRTTVDKLGDDLVKLVLEYRRLYPDVPEERARQMLTQLTALEQKLVSTRAAYLKKIGKVLPATKTLRFAQVESRLDVAVRLELAAQIPLVPTRAK